MFKQYLIYLIFLKYKNVFVLCCLIIRVVCLSMPICYANIFATEYLYFIHKSNIYFLLQGKGLIKHYFLIRITI